MLEAPPTGRPAPPLLVFDGDCGLCTRLAGLAQRWIPPTQGRVVAAAWIDVAHYGLTAEQCREALQFVDRHGRTFAAQDAVAHLLLSSRAWWRPLGVVALLPGVRQVAGVVYRWVARNRSRLPGGPPARAR